MGPRIREKAASVKNEATVEVFWRAYDALRPRERQELAERILRDRQLLDDAVDHVLIERAKSTKGKALALSDFESQVRRRACR